MTDGGDTKDDEQFPAEEAFALIGNDLRAEILRVLGENPHEGLSFSELREGVEMDVDSGQFNYHLQQLVGHFVERTDDGYELRASGLALYRAIKAGTFNQRVTIEPFAVGFDCYHCETAVEASYSDGAFIMECPGCDHVYSHMTVPPSAVTDGPEALLSRVEKFNRSEILLAANGVCPVCVNRMELDFRPGEAVWSEGAERHAVLLHRSCTHCGRENVMPIGMAMLEHPAIVSFFYDHGRTLTTIPHWELEWIMTDDALTVRSEEPWEFTLRVTLDGETLEVRIDEELNVVETTRN